MKKIFVFDTNVLINKPSCIFDFEENDIVIPDDVLEELDKFKSEFESNRGFQAREFLRLLDTLIVTSGGNLTKGISLGEGKGTIQVVHTPKKNSGVINGFSISTSVDNRIIYLCKKLSRQVTKTPIVLLSTDTNVRVKANAEGVTAKNYCGGSISSFESKSVDAVEAPAIESEYLGRSKTFVINSVYNGFQTGKEISLENLFEIHKDYPPYNDTLFKSSSFSSNEFIEVYDSTKIEVGRKLSKPIGGRFDSNINKIVPLVYVKKFLKKKKETKRCVSYTQKYWTGICARRFVGSTRYSPVSYHQGPSRNSKNIFNDCDSD